MEQLSALEKGLLLAIRGFYGLGRGDNRILDLGSSTPENPYQSVALTCELPYSHKQVGNPWLEIFQGSAERDSDNLLSRALHYLGQDPNYKIFLRTLAPGRDSDDYQCWKLTPEGASKIEERRRPPRLDSKTVTSWRMFVDLCLESGEPLAVLTDSTNFQVAPGVGLASELGCRLGHTELACPLGEPIPELDQFQAWLRMVTKQSLPELQLFKVYSNSEERGEGLLCPPLIREQTIPLGVADWPDWKARQIPTLEELELMQNTPVSELDMSRGSFLDRTVVKAAQKFPSLSLLSRSFHSRLLQSRATMSQYNPLPEIAHKQYYCDEIWWRSSSQCPSCVVIFDNKVATDTVTLDWPEKGLLICLASEAYGLSFDNKDRVIQDDSFHHAIEDLKSRTQAI